MEKLQTARSSSNSESFEGWLQQNRTFLLLIILGTALAFGIFYFVNLSKRTAQESAWSALTAFQLKGDENSAEVEKAVAGSSAEPWLLLNLASKAIDKEDFAKADSYLTRFDQLPNNPAKGLGGIVGNPGDKNLATSLRAKVQKYQDWKKQNQRLFENPAPPEKPRVTFVTDEGEIVLALFPNICPKTCENFIRQCKNPTYDGTRFFDLMENTSIRLGESTTRDDNPENWQTDKTSSTMDCEKSSLASFAGTVHMYRKDFSGPCSDTQFVINLRKNFGLDENNAVFAQVVKGLEIAENISKIKSSMKDNKRIPEKKVTVKEVRVEE